MTGRGPRVLGLAAPPHPKSRPLMHEMATISQRKSWPEHSRCSSPPQSRSEATDRSQESACVAGARQAQAIPILLVPAGCSSGW